MRIGFAADHRGFELKNQLLAALAQSSFEVRVEIRDFGASSFDACDDYPDFVIPLAKAIANQEVTRGIAICGSGVGACIAANKVRNVRAAIINDLFSARQGVEDDDMNILCLASHLVDLPAALELIQTFLSARFSEAPRHQRRLAKISKLEEMETQP